MRLRAKVVVVEEKEEEESKAHPHRRSCSILALLGLVLGSLCGYIFVVGTINVCMFVCVVGVVVVEVVVVDDLT